MPEEREAERKREREEREREETEMEKHKYGLGGSHKNDRRQEREHCGDRQQKRGRDEKKEKAERERRERERLKRLLSHLVVPSRPCEQSTPAAYRSWHRRNESVDVRTHESESQWLMTALHGTAQRGSEEEAGRRVSVLSSLLSFSLLFPSHSLFLSSFLSLFFSSPYLLSSLFTPRICSPSLSLFSALFSSRILASSSLLLSLLHLSLAPFTLTLSLFSMHSLESSFADTSNSSSFSSPTDPVHSLLVGGGQKSGIEVTGS